MINTNYLNYTHGNLIQTLCTKGIDAINSDTEKYRLCAWIREEMRKMCRSQSAVWGVTVSQLSYMTFLEKLLDEMSGQNRSGKLAEIREQAKQVTRDEIYILFLTQEPACFPSMESVFRAAEKDPRYKTALVYTPFFHENFSKQVDWFEAYKEMNLPVIRHDQYQLSDESPDIVLMIKPYANVPEGYIYTELKKVVERAIYIPYGMEITLDLVQFGYQYYLQYDAWRHISYGPIVQNYARRYGYRNGENVVAWGHPKADLYRDLQAGRETIPEEWKKRIGNRKTILWTPHHLIALDSDGTGTWLIWGKRILEEMLRNTDVMFIFRPHPMMFGALKNEGGMSSAEVEKIKQKIRNAENIIWDDSPSYLNAFYAADAIISDGTTFSVEFLYTGRPVILTPRNLHGFYIYKEMQRCYYIIETREDIQKYITMISEGQDPLLEKREQLRKNLFTDCGELSVAENILNHISQDLEKECTKLPCLFEEETEDSQSESVPEPVAVLSEEEKKQVPLVSILILCYKNLSLLYDMLHTVFVQDYPRIQLIISDDGSDDFNAGLVNEFIQLKKGHNIESVIVRKNEKNQGTVRNVRDGLKHVEGQYVIFTAADDRFVGQDVLSSYVEAFQSKPEAKWLVARCNFTSPDYRTMLYTSPMEKDEPYFMANDSILLFSRWSRRGMAIPCCMAFRADAFDLVGGIDLDFKYLEDWPLEMKLLRAGYSPIYLRKVTALHSTGGISNSNDRYGIELRKKFYNEKYLFFSKEVEPYRSLQTKEDKKCYRQYRKEIMARHFFFFIDWPLATGKNKIKLLLKKPIRFWWLFERWYMEHREIFYRKKMLAVAEGLLLASLLLLHFDTNHITNIIFRTIGIVELAAGVILGAAGVLTYPLEKYFEYKEKLRKDLVN